LVTHGCVKSSCQGAHELGYRVVLVADGHSSYSKDAARLIEEWNQTLSQATVELRLASQVEFSRCPL
jgi:nicotinamidase-related amidase